MRWNRLRKGNPAEQDLQAAIIEMAWNHADEKDLINIELNSSKQMAFQACKSQLIN